MGQPTSRTRSLLKAHPLTFALAAAAVFGAAGFATAITVSQTTHTSFFGTIDTVETTTAITSTSVSFTRVTAAAAGASSGAAQEMGAGASGAANTALTKAYWHYKAVVEESAAASVTSGTYKVELFVNDVSKGALYMTQASSIAGTVEGVTFKWELGADLPTGDSAYRIEITAA